MSLMPIGGSFRGRDDGDPLSITNSNDWEIENKHGRFVAVRPIRPDDPKSVKLCPDCGDEATQLVIELEDCVESNMIKKKSRQPLMWGYCGVCCIGG